MLLADDRKRLPLFCAVMQNEGWSTGLAAFISLSREETQRTTTLPIFPQKTCSKTAPAGKSFHLSTFSDRRNAKRLREGYSCFMPATQNDSYGCVSDLPASHCRREGLQLMNQSAGSCQVNEDTLSPNTKAVHRSK